MDEFGDDSLLTTPDVVPRELKRGVSEHFVLAAVGIRDTSRKPLAEALVQLKRRHFGATVGSEPWSASEIKGRHLFRVSRSVASGHVLAKPAAFARLDTAKKVDALIKDIGRVLSMFRPLIFAVAVDKRACLLAEDTKRKVSPPLGAAYTYLSQRVALTMERLHAGEGAILVADQQTQHEAFFRSGQMNDVRNRMTEKLWLQPQFSLVLDKPLWIDTALSTWDREILQLPDIVAYSVGELLKRGAAPAEACYLWERIRPNLALNWSSGTIESGGLAIYPKPAAYPDM